MLDHPRVRSPRALLLTCSAALALACGGADTRPADWSYIHAAIVAPSCATASCHSAFVAAGGLAFDDAAETRRLWVTRPYVTPGDPNSALMALLEGRERDRMPPDAPLPQADIDLIRRWIEEGAQP
jgi:hypothetical protein